MTKILQVPGSKSIAQRALICAALCSEPTTLENLPQGADVQNLVRALEKCGLQTENPAKNSTKIIPSNLPLDKGDRGDLLEKTEKQNFAGFSDLPPDKGARGLNVGHGGTPLRFLVSFLCQVPGTQTLDGSERLRQRPILPLIEALNKAGARISRNFPLEIGYAKLADEIEIDASASSQFLSSLLLSGKALGLKKIKVRGKKTSSAYLQLTIKVLADFGIKIRENGDYYEISGDYKSPRNYVIEPDWASAGYLLGASLLTKSGGKIAGLKKNSLQPDAHILPVLEKMGLKSREKNGFLEFSAEKLQSPGEVNCENFPDSAQTLAILAGFCEQETLLTGLKTLPFKECNRLSALHSELKKLSIQSEISRDSIKIFGGKLNSAKIETFHDHRMGMAFGMAQTILPNLQIDQPSVVAKSFPNYWNELSKFKKFPPDKGTRGFNFHKMTIIGDPIDHSLTPLLYNTAFAELGLNYICEKCPVSREKIRDFLANNDYEKLAITAPHKNIAAEFIKKSSLNLPPARRGGRGDLPEQINSLRYDQKIRGKNTDIPGIREVLADDLQDGQKVLLLGAGDTAKSVLEALEIYDLEIFIHNRTHEKAENLAKKFSATAIRNLEQISPDILISTLPFNCEPELDEKLWQNLQTIFSIGYHGKKLPKILNKAKSREKIIRTGGDLLWAQWKYQFEFLFDLPAPQDGKNLLKSFTNLTK